MGLNHVAAKHSEFRCEKCTFTTSTKLSLATHVTNEHNRAIFSCEQCNFEDSTEENVLNHTIAQHSTYLCELCDFSTTNDEHMSEHETNVHKRTKHTCTKCNFNFDSPNKLRELISRMHKKSSYPCDQCRFKAESLSELDTHIDSSHRIIRNKNSDIRDLRNRSPCNFTDPAHTKDCCDRTPGPPRRVFTRQERLKNGPCRNWTESVCNFSELCKFAHINICHFQTHCRNSEKCSYYHYDGSNQAFL